MQAIAPQSAAPTRRPPARRALLECRNFSGDNTLGITKKAVRQTGMEKNKLAFKWTRDALPALSAGFKPAAVENFNFADLTQFCHSEPVAAILTLASTCRQRERHQIELAAIFAGE